MANFHPGYLEQGQPLGMTYNQVLLTADDQNVDPTYPAPVSMLQVGSDNTTATSRTFTLTPNPQVGALLLLYFYTGSSTTCELADSGNCKLASAWTPTQYDVLWLVSDGTYWNELCRGSSTGLPALTSAHIFVGNASNVATDVAVSGDVTMANTGAVTIASSAVTLSKIASAVVAEATGTITSAQLLALDTPVVLVAAPGAGKVLVVDEIELFHSYSTTQYATGADLEIEYQTAGTNIVLVDKGLVTAAASKSVVMQPTIYDLDNSTGTSEGFDVTSLANKAVQITAASAFTNGNAANVLKYNVRYHVKTLLT